MLEANNNFNYWESKMIKMPLMSYRILFTLLAALFLSTPAFAEKPDGDGQGKGRKHSQKHESRGHDGGSYQDKGGSNVSLNVYFGDRQRTIIRDYYAQEFRRGHCPPGLAKKHNGCMPPGQAKKWKKGYPLPRDVVFYDLPPRIIIELGTPPAGHRYVRVASDILLIAIGTGMVVDAIDDLGNM